MRTSLIPIVAIVCLLLLPGCLFGSKSNTKSTGNFVSEQTMTKVEVGMEREQVESLLGTPSEKVNLADGSQTWKWKSKKTTTSEDWAFLLFKNESTLVEEGTAFVEFDPDGVVTKSWRD